MAHPLIVEVKHCEDAIRRYLAEIGFSPAARSRLGLAQVQVASKLDESDARREKRRQQAAVVKAEVASEPGADLSTDADKW